MNAYTGYSTLESMSQAKLYNKWTFGKFNEYLKGTILEVGCGIGNFTPDLSKYGTVTAIDIDQQLIEKFRNQKNSKISLGFGDIEKGEFFFQNKRSFLDKTFDTIVCLNVLEHIQNDIQALENIHKLLKKDGHLILLVPIYSFLYGEIDKSVGHFRRYNPEQLLKKMQDAGYTIISNRKLNFLGAIGWFIAGRIFKNKHIEGNKIQLFNILSPVFLLAENLIEPIIGTSILIIAKKK